MFVFFVVGLGGPEAKETRDPVGGPEQPAAGSRRRPGPPRAQVATPAQLAAPPATLIRFRAGELGAMEAAAGSRLDKAAIHDRA